MQRYLPQFFVLLFVLLGQASAVPAWTIPILGLGTPPPPEALRTTDISPQCSANNGTYMCCHATFDGGNPIVKKVTDKVHYILPANTVNGYLCEKSKDTCKGLLPVCCQVTTLYPIWGLWCQTA
ncbi:hypothetical protein H072_5933 [Dactylellina haptotyla CBS 200.50]|uniref:Hydrophobin n=1 Tax=Dactylellina haptotyla (strain CBS 200.50) TaxID=1284197 RepID=S8ABF1_DACHA|nr:hypothetical protein H072_5933 [Dactylellina haptotyla CBS 200.50]